MPLPVESGRRINSHEAFFIPEPFNGSFIGKDVISVEQFTSIDEIKFLFRIADEMRRSVEAEEIKDNLRGCSVALLFYQPSTRTFSSFLAAAQRLGASYETPIAGMTYYSSAVKGESLADTVRTIEQTTRPNLIILRHPNDDSSAEAAHFAHVPIINAGSGRIAHPTQAILDLYTIQEELGRIDNLTVTMIGDLRNGRTIKSLSKLLMIDGRGIKFNFVSPPVLRMPKEITTYLKKKGAEIYEGDSDELNGVLGETDVLYVTRVQGEWFVRQALENIKANLGTEIDGVKDETLLLLAEEMGKQEYQEAVEGYVIDQEKLALMKEKMAIMHPLPRVGEIACEVDEDPRVAYFRQMRNGLYARMALLAAVLGKV